jgi:hypothetical protein
MDLRQLRYFVGTVQAGSLSRAADQLHVAQSALSHHLASLEAELDTQLVIRGPKGIVLAEAGSVLCRDAEAILRHVESAKQAGVQIADLAAYCMSWTLRLKGMDKPTREELRPYIDQIWRMRHRAFRHKMGNPNFEVWGISYIRDLRTTIEKIAEQPEE